MQSDILHDVRQTAINFASILVCSSIAFTIISQKLLGLYFVVGLGINAIGNYVLKKVCSSVFAGKSWIQRPNKLSEFGCASFVFCNKKDKNKNQHVQETDGMPSGHSQAATFSSMFWILFILFRKRQHQKIVTNLTISLQIIILILCAVLIMISRHYENCHTWSQIIVGGFFGILIGFVYYFMLDRTNNLY